MPFKTQEPSIYIAVLMASSQQPTARDSIDGVAVAVDKNATRHSAFGSHNSPQQRTHVAAATRRRCTATFVEAVFATRESPELIADVTTSAANVQRKHGLVCVRNKQLASTCAEKSWTIFRLRKIASRSTQRVWTQSALEMVCFCSRFLGHTCRREK